MAKATAKVDRTSKEGHGEDGPVPSVSKGTYVAIGTAVSLSNTATSVNKKSGTEQSDQW